MVSINRVTLIGNVGQPPELKAAGSGQYARWSMATNENYQDKQGVWQTDTEWHNIKLWGRSAERAITQIKKGSLVYVEGSIRSYEYEGKKLSEIKALTWRLLDSKSDDPLPGQLLGPEPTSWPTNKSAQPTSWHTNATAEKSTKWGEPHPANTQEWKF